VQDAEPKVKTRLNALSKQAGFHLAGGERKVVPWPWAQKRATFTRDKVATNFPNQGPRSQAGFRRSMPACGRDMGGVAADINKVTHGAADETKPGKINLRWIGQIQNERLLRNSGHRAPVRSGIRLPAGWW